MSDGAPVAAGSAISTAYMQTLRSTQTLVSTPEPRTQDLSIAMVAGEPSGDLLAGLMLDAVKFNWPNGYWFGIGGPQMIQRGFVAWWPQHLLAVRGYIEVLPRLWKRAGRAPAAGGHSSHPLRQSFFLGLASAQGCATEAQCRSRSLHFSF